MAFRENVWGTSKIPISPPIYYGLWDLEKFRVFDLGRILSSSICLYRDLEKFELSWAFHTNYLVNLVVNVVRLS